MNRTMLVVSLAGLSACGAEMPEVDSLAAALTAAECQQFAVGGKVTVCHATKKGLQATKVTVAKCLTHVSHPDDIIAVNGVCVAAPTCTGTCGDTSGPSGGDLPCCCGDTVTSDTTLAGDPVTQAACPAGGLALGAGVDLDLGGSTVSGSGGGAGITVAAGGAIRNGTVSGFGTGVLVDGADPAARVAVTGVTSRLNLGDGILVRAAPGAADLDDPTAQLDVGGFGVVVDTVEAHGNGGHGVHLAGQAADVSARVEQAELHHNAGAGLLLEQRAGVAFRNNHPYDNRGPGVELLSGFILTPVGRDLGFTGNDIHHNGFTAGGCDGLESAPQVLVSGPVGLGNATCAAAANQAECAAIGELQDCGWTGVDCRVAWDLRGDLDETCFSASRNRIFDYNLSQLAGPEAVGMRATNGSFVVAQHNMWRISDSTENVSYDVSSFIEADPMCPGVILQCQSLP